MSIEYNIGVSYYFGAWFGGVVFGDNASFTERIQ